MRVLIDTTFAGRGPSGTAVYLRRLVPALRRTGVEVFTAANERRPPPAGGGLGSLRNVAADAQWLHAGLPAAARRVRADVVHHPLPAWSPVIRAAQVITVHDLAFERLPWAFDRRFRTWARAAHRIAARRADAVVCVSAASAEDARALWRLQPERIVVARHGPGQEPDHAFPGPRTARAFLYVGDDEPRKNVRLLLDAHARYRADGGALPLVLAGTWRPGDSPLAAIEWRPGDSPLAAIEWRPGDSPPHATRQPGRPGDSPLAAIERVERPDETTLARLYAECAALVHPALHEGFGLTVLEAMSAGAPVVAVRSPGVEEVGGDAILYVPPDDPPALAAVLRTLERDPALRRRLGEQGRRRAAEFSWARSAQAHAAAYALALGG